MSRNYELLKSKLDDYKLANQILFEMSVGMPKDSSVFLNLMSARQELGKAQDIMLRLAGIRDNKHFDNAMFEYYGLKKEDDYDSN